MTEINHVLLTRFNLPSGGVEGVIRAREGWLRERIELFERYSVPSVAAQTVADLSWIVYLDPESPDWLIERLAPLAADGLFRPILRAEVHNADLVADIAETVGDRREGLLTTNLDNDDGLAADFCARLQAVRTDHTRVALYMKRGLIKTPQGVYLATDRRNAFCSVRETWAAPVTAWSQYHNELPKVMPFVLVDGPPGWLQVVHGSNVSNRAKGRLVSPAPYRPRFGALLDDAAEPGHRELTRDRLLGHPARMVRDTSRSAARRSALRVLGKERYGAIKRGLLGLSRRHR